MQLLKKRYLCDCGRWFFDIEGPAMCAMNEHEAGSQVQEPHPISKYNNHKKTGQSNKVEVDWSNKKSQVIQLNRSEN
jgi:hypothetical protein